jgi:hypothetical protein
LGRNPISFVIHLAFLIVGRTEFRTAASLIILGLALVFSLSLGWIAVSMKRAPSQSEAMK